MARQRTSYAWRRLAAAITLLVEASTCLLEKRPPCSSKRPPCSSKPRRQTQSINVMFVPSTDHDCPYTDFCITEIEL